MTEKNSSFSNIDLQAGRAVDEILNSNQKVNSIDKIKALLSRVKEDHASADPGEYYGLLLHTIPRSTEYMDSLYNSESKFYKEIMRAHGTGKSSKKSTIYECTVHVPEVSGVLPYPDLDIIHESLKPPNEAASETYDYGEWLKEYPSKLAAAFPEILKLSMYPKFYYYNPDHGMPAPGHMCKVRFSDSIPTAGAGIYLKSLSVDFTDVEGL